MAPEHHLCLSQRKVMHQLRAKRASHQPPQLQHLHARTGAHDALRSTHKRSGSESVIQAKSMASWFVLSNHLVSHWSCFGSALQKGPHVKCSLPSVFLSVDQQSDKTGRQRNKQAMSTHNAMVALAHLQHRPAQGGSNQQIDWKRGVGKSQ